MKVKRVIFNFVILIGFSLFIFSCSNNSSGDTNKSSKNNKKGKDFYSIIVR